MTEMINRVTVSPTDLPPFDDCFNTQGFDDPEISAPYEDITSVPENDGSEGVSGEDRIHHYQVADRLRGDFPNQFESSLVADLDSATKGPFIHAANLRETVYSDYMRQEEAAKREVIDCQRIIAQQQQRIAEIETQLAQKSSKTQLQLAYIDPVLASAVETRASAGDAARRVTERLSGDEDILGESQRIASQIEQLRERIANREAYIVKLRSAQQELRIREEEQARGLETILAVANDEFYRFNLKHSNEFRAIKPEDRRRIILSSRTFEDLHAAEAAQDQTSQKQKEVERRLEKEETDQHEDNTELRYLERDLERLAPMVAKRLAGAESVGQVQLADAIAMGENIRNKIDGYNRGDWKPKARLQAEPDADERYTHEDTPKRTLSAGGINQMMRQLLNE